MSRSERAEHGTALVVALFAAVVIVLIGAAHLVMSRTESEIAANESAALQARYAAESAAYVVKLWFEQPGSAPAFPPIEAVVRERAILDETDPHGTGASPGGPQYKENTDLDGDGQDDLFAWPWAGATVHAFLGTPEAPDLRIEDATALAALAQAAFGDFPDRASGLRAVVRRVDVYAPPYVHSGGGFRPHGTATVLVLAAVEPCRPGSGRPLAERTATLVLTAAPYAAGLFGALHACADAEVRGPHGVGWGALAVNGAVIGDPLPPVPPGPPRALPGLGGADRLWTDDPAWVAAYSAALDPTAAIVDPWVRLIAGGPITGAPSGVGQPWAGTPPPSPGSPAPWLCCDGSNAFQHQTWLRCPDAPYALWKRIARSGLRGVHYLAWDGSAGYLDDGGGGPRTFEQIFADAAGEPGVWFFDTADGRAPRDDDGDGRADNLTPPLDLGPGWRARGFVYVHAERIVMAGLEDTLPETLRAPGEPFVGEPDAWIDLAYPHEAHAPVHPGTPGSWEPRGPAIETAVAFRGVLVTPGDLELRGGGTLYGAVAARSVLLDGSSVPPTRLLRDAGLEGPWPPTGWPLPRFLVSQVRVE